MVPPRAQSGKDHRASLMTHTRGLVAKSSTEVTRGSVPHPDKVWSRRIACIPVRAKPVRSREGCILDPIISSA